jgi:hypothetical protein
MKKFTLLMLSLFVAFLGYTQSNNPNADLEPGAVPVPGGATKGSWTIQFKYGSVPAHGAAGCETDGSNFYVTQWNGDSIWKFSMSGQLLGGFTISGVGHLRDLAYDGQYFYGGKATNVIYKMDFSTTPPSLVSTITSPIAVRHIAYNPAADNGNGGFYVGNWNTDIKLVSRTGATLQTIPAATHGLTSSYGSAYDTISPGGPYLWMVSASSHTLTQLNATTGAPTGLTHDLSDVDPNGGYGGGLWIEPNIVSGTVTLGGLIQNRYIYGYDLTTTVSDTFDLSMEVFNLANMVPIGQNVDIKGSLTNEGIDTITSFDLNYQVDNGSVVTQNITGVSIASFDSYSFTHSTPWVPANGVHTVSVWASNLNGHADQNTSNDTITKQTVGYNPASAVQRIPLYETFTSSTCGPCVAGNTNMQALFQANPNKWTCVKYQMSWPNPGDPYYTAEGGVRRQFYGVNSVPRQEIDGGFDGNSSSVTQTDFDNAYAAPAFMGITANMTISGQSVNVSYTIDPKIDFPSNATLFIAIVERTTNNNVGTNGETEFHWVMKKMLPDASGTIIGPLTAGTNVTGNKQYTFQGSYRLPANAQSPINHATEHSVEHFDSLIAVVWVQHPLTKSVYQSAFSSVTIGMDEAQRANLIKAIYPNPATDQINIDLNMEQSENVQVSIFNTLEQILYTNNYGDMSGANTLNIPLDNYSEGIYFVKIRIGDKLYTKPVSIK